MQLPQPLARHPFAWALAVAAAVLIGLWLVPATQLTPGFDEVAHVGAARYLYQYGSDPLNPEHPPLVKRLVGWALSLSIDDGGRPPALRTTPNQWRYGQEVLAPGGVYQPQRMFISRLPMLAIALLGLVAVGRFGFRLAGALASAVAMGLYAASPIVVAGASMVITDLPVGVFALACLHLSRVAARAYRPWIAFWAGAAGAAALMSKYSGLIVPPIAVGLMLLQMLLDRCAARRMVLTVAAFVTGLLSGAWLCAGPLSVDDYVKGLEWVGANHITNYPYYAFGHYSPVGFWWYFPVVLGVKSTLAELFGLAALGLLLPLAAMRAQGSERWRRWVDWVWLSALPGSYLIALMLGAIDVGQRYLAPMYPFACVAAGVLVVQVSARRRPLLVGSLLAIQLASVAVSLPDPMSFFNGIAGCRGIRAVRCLDDSNIDWGQNLNRIWPAVSDRLAPDEALQVDLFTTMPIRTFLPRFREIGVEGWRRPRPGLYVISAHILVRRMHDIRGIENSPLFQHIDPSDHIGNSLFVVDLRDQAPGPLPGAPQPAQ